MYRSRHGRNLSGSISSKSWTRPCNSGCAKTGIRERVRSEPSVRAASAWPDRRASMGPVARGFNPFWGCHCRAGTAHFCRRICDAAGAVAPVAKETREPSSPSQRKCRRTLRAVSVAPTACFMICQGSARAVLAQPGAVTLRQSNQARGPAGDWNAGPGAFRRLARRSGDVLPQFSD